MNKQSAYLLNGCKEKKMNTIKRIHFPMELDYLSGATLIKQFENAERKFNEIHLIIRSFGGDTRIAISFVNLVNECKSKVIAFADSWCDSVASFVFISCHKRIITSETTMLVHPQSVFMENRRYDEFLEDCKEFEENKNIYTTAYANKTSLPKERIEKLFLCKEYRFNAKEIMDFGMADEMISPTFSNWVEK